MAPAIEARDVTFRRCGRSLVQRVSLCVHRGELLVLCGPAGGGAGTVLELLAGTVAPDIGRILVDGVTAVPGIPRPRDPRRFATGPAAAHRVLTDAADDSVLLLEAPTAGLDTDDAFRVLDSCVSHAHGGAAVVVALEDSRLAATFADTIALVVAGRLLGWGAPGVALVPALRLLGVASGSSL